MTDDPVGQPAEGQGLEVHRACAAKRGQKQAFSTEEHGLQAASCLDGVVDAGREAHNASRVHPERFVVEVTLHHRAARVEERHPVAFQFLEDEPLAAEEPGA